MKFSLRDLFWLTLVAACCVMWWQDRTQLNRFKADQANEAERANQIARFYVQVYGSQNATNQVNTAPGLTVVPASAAGESD